MRPMIKAVVLSLTLAGVASAQSVHWEPSTGTLGVGQTTQIDLDIEGCTISTVPPVPTVEGLAIQLQGQSREDSIINGAMSSRLVLRYAAMLTKKHPVDIPAFKITTSKGELTVPAAHFDAGEATVGSTGLSIDQVAAARLSTTPSSVWAGQVFDVAYSIDVDATYYPEFGTGQVVWDPAPLVAEEWTQPEQFRSSASGATRDGLAYKTRALAHTAGQIQIPPTRQVAALRVGVTGFGFFQERQIQQFAITGSTPSIEVKPLPPGPQGFAGAVGQFKISSKVVPQSVSVGDPITWTIELKGMGNWPDIPGLPSRAVSQDFQVVQPKAKKTMTPGKLFDATLSEDVVLIPTKPGTYTLGPVTFTYFDPKKGAYQDLQTAPVTITVKPSAATAAAAAAPEDNHPAAPLAAPAQHPEAPSGIPRDPLVGSSSADAPLQPVILAWAAAIIAGLVLISWAIFAVRRAKRTDRELSRRQARDRVAAAVEGVAKADPASRPELLRAWQQDTAILLKIQSAAPSAGAVSDPAWTELWSEADRAIYGERHELPDSWVARAREALAKTPVPKFSAGQLFLPRNLFPFFALLLLVSLSDSARADEGNSAYRSGEFTKAEKAWKDQLVQNPLDWRNRYNLSLAYAQEDRWGEASAQATAAFLQHPSDPVIRWQFALTCDKAQVNPNVVGDFLQPSPSESFARLQSAPEWQRICIIGLAAFGLGLVLLLAAAYGSLPKRWTNATALILLALGLLASALSWGAIRAYGIAGNERAAMVWRTGTLRSVPTEAEVPQKTSTLAAGSVAVIDATFLGWARLRFEDGQTGWVRQDEIIALWR